MTARATPTPMPAAAPEERPDEEDEEPEPEPGSEVEEEPGWEEMVLVVPPEVMVETGTWRDVLVE